MELSGAFRRHISVRSATAVSILLMTLVSALPAAAQSAPEVAAEAGLDGYVDPFQPIPIRVELTSPVLWVGSLSATLGSQRASVEIEVPAGGAKVYELVLPAPGSNVNRQIRLRFTPEGADEPSDTLNLPVQFATDVELVAVLDAPELGETLDQARTVATGTDIDVAEIGSISPALGVASYLVTRSGGLDGLSAEALGDLEAWVLDGGRLVAGAADVSRLGAPDSAPVPAGPAQVAQYGAGEVIIVDTAALDVDGWSEVIRPTPGTFVSPNFGNPAGFDLFQAATGDTAAGTPQIPWLLGGLVAYALLVGPVNFLVLRAIGRRQLVWMTIPALSAVAVFAFWLFGPRTAVAQVTHASAIVLDGEEGTARSGLVMVAGQEGRHTLGVPEGWVATPAGDLRQFFGPVALGGTDVVETGPGRLTFDTDSLEAVPVTASHAVSLAGLDVSARIDGRRVVVDVDNQTDASFWFWGVGVGLSAVAGDDELEPGQAATQQVQPGVQQDPWQAPMVSAYWNRRTGFFEEGNEVWQIIEPLAREVGRTDRRLFQGDPYFFGYTDDLSWEVTVDGRPVSTRGPALIMVPLEFTDTDRFSLGRTPAVLLSTTGQEFIEEGFTPFIVGADEVFVRFDPPPGVSSASVRISNPFGGPATPDVAVFSWARGEFVDVVDIVGNRVERFELADYLHPAGEMIVRLDPRDFGEIFPSSVVLEWTP